MTDWSGALRALMGSTFIGVIQGDGDLIVDANDAFLRIVGYTRDDLATGALRWPELTPAEWAASDEVAYHQLVATGEQTPIEKEYVRHDGSRVPVLVHAVMRDDGGWVALVVDLGARRDSNAALRLGERRYRSLAEATNAVVWSASALGSFIAPQPAWEAYTGQSWEEYRDFGFSLAVHPRDRDAAIADWRAAVQRGEDFEREVLLWHAPSRAYRAGVVRGFPVRDDEGVVHGWVGTVTDVHEGARAERADRLRVAMGELLRAGRPREETYDGLVRLPLPDFGDLCYLYLNQEGRRVAIAHVDPDLEAHLRRLEVQEPLDPASPMPAARSARTGTTVFLPVIDDEQRSGATRSPRVREAVDRLAMTSAIAVPVRTGDGTSGSLLFAYTEASGRAYDARDVELAEEIGERFGQLLENERLNAERRHAQARVEVLARIGELASTELDLDTRLHALPSLMIPALGDSCTVYVTEPDGQAVRIVAFANVQPALQRAIGAPEDWPLLPIDSPSPGATAVRTGATFLDETRDASVPSTYLDGRPLVAANIAGLGSVLSVPLRTADGPMGAIAFGYARGGRRYSTDDIPLAEEVARRVTMLLHHAQRFERERGIAEMLQRSFLPRSLPVLARHAVAVRYLPGTAGLKVGGDWYDVVPLRDGRVVVAVGDVAGHGVEAAGTMGRVRTSLRVHARAASGAADLLDRLNQYVFDEEHDEMVTLAVLVLDPASDLAECALAGHPPPLARGADGVRELVSQGGPPLGVRRAQYADTLAPLLAGETLLLYTDGLVERRGESFDVGLQRLVDAMQDAPESVEGAATHVLHRLLHGDAPADDVALVAVRVTHEPARLRMSFEPDLGELHVMRELLRRWARQFGADDEVIDDMVLVAGEAAANAIEHAHSKSANAFLLAGDCDGDGLVVEVRDFGRWREPRADHDGRGLKLMRALADDLTIERHDDGTAVRFRSAFAGAATPVDVTS